MNNIELCDVRSEHVNGGVVYIPSEVQINELIYGGALDGRLLSMPESAKKLLVLIEGQERIIPALQSLGEGLKWVMMLLFVRNNGKLQRTYYSGAICDSCGAVFHSVDPTVSDLYFLTDNSLNRRHEAWAIVRSEQPNCPVCGGRFSMPALYVWPVERKKGM